MTEIKVHVDPGMKKIMAKKKKMTQNVFMNLHGGECAHTPVACPFLIFFSFVELLLEVYGWIYGTQRLLCSD